MVSRDEARALGTPSRIRALTLLASVALLASPLGASAKTILVIGPHPDDEILLGAGRVRQAVLNGDAVKTVVVTNGDEGSLSVGYTRQGYSVSAAQILGLTEQDVIFLGYSMDLLAMYRDSSGTTVFTGGSGQTTTNGTRGLGGMDYHRYVTGTAGSYTRDTLLSDLRTLFQNLQPDEIYTTSYFDAHPDHRGVGLFVIEALAGLKRSGVDLRTQLYLTIVWDPHSDWSGTTWPYTNGYGLGQPFVPPPSLAQTTHAWDRAIHLAVPPEMQSTDPATNLKLRAIDAYRDYIDDHLRSFARKDEFFWRYDVGDNVALTATATASSTMWAPVQAAPKAINGVVDGDPHDYRMEWISSGETAGAWIQLTWTAPVTISQVNLHDRMDPAQNVLAGTLLFSDGSSVPVGALEPHGYGTLVTFSPRTVTWVRFRVDQAQGSATGLAEIEVLGRPSSSSANLGPGLLGGLVASPASITTAQASSLSVSAWDLDGGALQYAWSADAGSVQGDGPTALFTPPPVSASTLVTLTVTVSDAQGASTSASTFVTVVQGADSVAVSPAAVYAGAASQGTVSLALPAPAGGTVVSLSSSNAGMASVPASVTVPAGANTATFPIATGSVSSVGTASIVASLPGGPGSASLTVNPNTPAGVALSPTSVTGGSSAQATVTINGVAGGAGAALTLASSNPAATVPATVTIPAGSSTATFTIGTTAVAVATTAAISATLNGATQSANLAIAPPSVSGLAVSPASLVGGAPVTGTVTLGGPAPAAGAVVALSSNSASATVPASVTVAAGATTATFTVGTAAVSSSAIATVTASYGGTATAGLALRALTLSPSPTALVGGGTATGTVALSGATAQAVTATLSSSNSGVAAVPASVTIAAGATSATFTITTSAVAASTGVTLTASSGTATTSGILTVTPALAVAGLSLAPSSLVGGGGATGTVTLNAAAGAGGAPILLSSSDAPRASAPATVTVAAGATSATFAVATAAVSASTPVTFTASYGTSGASAALTLLPLTPSALALSPGSVVGGFTSQATVTLAGPAPGGGAVVVLGSSNPAATVPATVTVPAGASSATFTVSTSAVAAGTVATVSASLGGVTRTASLTVSPPSMSLLVLDPTLVVGGGTANATAVLTGPAPAGGATVTLTSDSAAAPVPSSVLVPAGANMASFTLTTPTVTSRTTATITATQGGATTTATLTVRPSGKTILVIGAQPQDETLLGAGRVRQAVLNGDVVKTIVLSNGDWGTLATGTTRQGQSVAAAQLLGLSEEDVIFMGYSDILYDLYSDSAGTTVIQGWSGQATTNASRGLGGMDYHRYLNGTAGSYTRNTLLADLRALLQNFRPDEIYTTSYFDAQADRRAVPLFLIEAILGLKQSGVDLPTQLYMTYLSSDATWPYVSGFGLGQPFPPPPTLGTTTQAWDRAIHLAVPAEMQTTDPATNLKLRAINAYGYYVDDRLRSFARRDEFFWRYDFGDNLATRATATASSTMWAPVQAAPKAVDGVADGDPHDYRKEWISSGERAGAWLQLDWAAAVTVSQVNLYDRENRAENVQAGTLLFSDGSSVPVGALEPGGSATAVTFSPRTVTWVRFRIDQAQGTATGLAEIEVLGKPASSSANLGPGLLRGPAATPASITSAQTSSLSVSAWDLDGGSLQYAWSSDAGSVQGSSATAVFTPPAVSSPTVVTLSVRVSDAQGGSTSASTFVTVTP